MFLKKEISSDEINLQVTGPLSGEPANEFQKNLEEKSFFSVNALLNRIEPFKSRVAASLYLILFN